MHLKYFQFMLKRIIGTQLTKQQIFIYQSILNRYDLLQQFWMPIKILIVILSFTCFYLVPVTSVEVHCLGYSIGVIPTSDQFKYRITIGWDERWKSEAAHHIYVEGWNMYEDHRASPFYTEIAQQTSKILDELNYTSKEVTFDIHNETFRQTTNDMQIAFGEIAKSRLYTVPKGKVVVGLRFQPKNPQKRRLGRWSVLLDLIDRQKFNARDVALYVLDKIKEHSLNPQVISSSLNFIPPFLAKSIFTTLQHTIGLRGTVSPIEYEGFILAIPQSQQFLGGAIKDGQKDIIQILDKIRTRNICSQESYDL